MSRIAFEFTRPERFLIGTVGVPGEREFFLQVKGLSNGRKTLASFGLEKSQAAALADRSREILRELNFSSAASGDISALETPIESEFTMGVMSLSWLNSEGLFLFEAQSIQGSTTEDVIEDLVSDESEDAPPILRVRLEPSELDAFARRTERVVAAGRQPCVFCGGPVNPGGHLCPRANGYRRQI